MEKKQETANYIIKNVLQKEQLNVHGKKIIFVIQKDVVLKLLAKVKLFHILVQIKRVSVQLKQKEYVKELLKKLVAQHINVVNLK